VPGPVLAANNAQATRELEDVWDDRDAVTDIAFAAGLLGLLSGLMTVSRFGAHFPDPLFWRALPLLLTLPPGFFLAALCVPGNWLGGRPGGLSRAAGLVLSGLVSYVAPLLWLAVVAALAALR
jgi:hypothetical protein